MFSSKSSQYNFYVLFCNDNSWLTRDFHSLSPVSCPQYHSPDQDMVHDWVLTYYWRNCLSCLSVFSKKAHYYQELELNCEQLWMSMRGSCPCPTVELKYLHQLFDQSSEYLCTLFSTQHRIKTAHRQKLCAKNRYLQIIGRYLLLLTGLVVFMLQKYA